MILESSKKQSAHIDNETEDKQDKETSSSATTEKSADNSRKMKVEDEGIFILYIKDYVW